jgi:hypothetical protein
MVNFPEIHEKYPDAAIAEAVLEKLGREARQPGADLDDVVNWVPHTAIVSLLEFVASNPEMQKKWGAVSHDDFSSLLWRVNEYYRFSTARAKGLVSPEGEAQSIFYFGPSGYSPKRISLTDSPARRLSPDTVLFDTDFFVRALMEQMNGSPYADFDVLRYFSNFDESSARKLTKILASVLGKIGSRGYFFATPTKLLQRIDSLRRRFRTRATWP